MVAVLSRTERRLRILFSVGFYLVLVAIQMVIVFFLNPRSIQNDVFMANLFIGPAFLLGGIILCGVGLWQGQHAGTKRLTLYPLVFAIGGAILFGLYYWLLGNRYYAFHETVSSLPPYIGVQEFVLSVVLGAVVGLLAGRWPIYVAAKQR